MPARSLPSLGPVLPVLLSPLGDPYECPGWLPAEYGPSAFEAWSSIPDLRQVCDVRNSYSKVKSARESLPWEI